MNKDEELLIVCLILCLMGSGGTAIWEFFLQHDIISSLEGVFFGLLCLAVKRVVPGKPAEPTQQIC